MKLNLLPVLLFPLSPFMLSSCGDVSTVSSFKAGDKLYLETYKVTDTTFKRSVEKLYVKIRPLTDNEVDNMDSDLSEKELIKRNLSTWDRSYLIQTGWGAGIDSLCKYKTACIGTFVEAISTNIKTDQGYETETFYKIKPNKKVFTYDVENGDPKKTPETYTKDDDELSSYFIEESSVKGVEAKKFRKFSD